jgi:hypothetical protein
VRIFWLAPPAAPGLQARWDRSGEEASYDRFVAGFLERHPNLTLVDARASGYRADRFLDRIHLDREGALALSTQLGALLHDESGGNERVVRLGAPRTPAAAPAVEDLGASRAAVRETRGLVR